MRPKAIVGLVRSRMEYIRDWPECIAKMDDDAEPAPERVFDLSEIVNAKNEQHEVTTDYAVVGRHLPFPIFAVVGDGEGVFIYSGGETGMYVYCYSAPVPMLSVRFTPTGWTYEGVLRRADVEPSLIPGSDYRVKQFADAAGMLLTLVEAACDNTRHVVSYTLNRAERRNAIKETGYGNLDRTLVHHVCLNAKARTALTERRGATVVPTPKRLHEVRSHWRHLKSGQVVRVRSHRRGSRGDVLLPRVYTASESVSSSRPEGRASSEETT